MGDGEASAAIVSTGTAAGSLYVPYGSGPTCFVFGSDLCLSDISWPSDITTGGCGIN